MPCYSRLFYGKSSFSRRHSADNIAKFRSHDQALAHTEQVWVFMHSSCTSVKKSWLAHLRSSERGSRKLVAPRLLRDLTC
jgi:hypothetical protein